MYFAGWNKGHDFIIIIIVIYFPIQLIYIMTSIIMAIK